MNSFRLGRLHIIALVAAVSSFCSLTVYPQHVLAKPRCGGRNCTLVRIDHVTGTELKYITASGKAGTYILTCLAFECQVPIQGQLYEYSQMPMTEPRDDRYALLTGPKVKNEQYSLEVIVPELPPLQVWRLIGQCQSSDQFASEADCGKWLTRKLAILRRPCPDPEAAIACESFRELVRANDPDVMGDLAEQDHVYACFLPGKDEFFEATFSEPSWFGFAKPSAEQIRDGVPSEALTIVGGSEFAYYKNGVGDENMSLHNLGNWIYFPLGEKTDPESMRKDATSKRAEFKGKNIDIEGDRWILTETYKNQADTETRHTVIVQLATGRFAEDFVLTATGNSVREDSGRCLVVPSDYF